LAPCLVWTGANAPRPPALYDVPPGSGKAEAVER
jgi:hypothetical protein